MLQYSSIEMCASSPLWNFGVRLVVVVVGMLRFLVFQTQESVLHQLVLSVFIGYLEIVKNLPNKNCLSHSKTYIIWKLAHLGVKVAYFIKRHKIVTKVAYFLFQGHKIFRKVAYLSARKLCTA